MPDSGEAALQAEQPAGEAGAIERWLIRVRAYFRKEVSELRRQPMLILSLIGGPLRSSGPLCFTLEPQPALQ